MNTAMKLKFQRNAQSSEDLRPGYEASVAKAFAAAWRWKYLIVLVIMVSVGAAIVAGSFIPKKYASEALILLKFDGAGVAAGTSGAGNPVTMDAAAVAEGEADIIRSRAMARRVAEVIDKSGKAALPHASATERDRQIVALQKDLSVETDGKSYLIHVRYKASDPARAALLANTFATQFLQGRGEDSYMSAKQRSDWLAAQVSAAEAAVRQADARAQAFRDKQGVVTTGTGGQQVSDQQLSDAIGQLSGARLREMELTAKLKRIKDAVAAGRVPSASDLSSSPIAQQLVQAELAASQQADRAKATFGVKHPLFVHASKTLADVRSRLSAAVDNAVVLAQAEVDSARSDEQQLAGKVEVMKRAAHAGQTDLNALNMLEADSRTAHADLDRLQESYRQALALAALKPISADLVSQAEPLTIPVSPKLPLVLASGGLLGLVLSALAVFALESRDRGVLTGTEIESEFDLACVGMLPALPRAKNVAARRVHEKAVRSLIMRSGLSTPDGGEPAIVAVTSSLPGEATGDMVRSLATSLAENNRRVLVIEVTAKGRLAVGERTDADGSGDQMPRLSTERLRREDENTAITFYRPTIRDFGTVFDSTRHLRTWLGENSANYDIVIVEAPPILVGAGAEFAIRLANLVLFAVKWNDTPKATVRAALDELDAIMPSTAPVGVVLTSVDLKRHRKLGIKDSLYFFRRHAKAASAAA